MVQVTPALTSHLTRCILSLSEVGKLSTYNPQLIATRTNAKEIDQGEVNI
jgi:hypothetical protein